VPAKESDDILFVTSFGRALRAPSDSFREQGAAGRGVAGITVDAEGGDSLADAVLVGERCGTIVLSCSGNLFAAFSASDMKTTNRGGKGMYIHRGDKPSAGKIESVCPCAPGGRVRAGETEIPCGAVPTRDIGLHTRISMVTLEELSKLALEYSERNEIPAEQEAEVDAERSVAPEFEDATADDENDADDANNANETTDEEGE